MKILVLYYITLNKAKNFLLKLLKKDILIEITNFKTIKFLIFSIKKKNLFSEK